MGDRVSPSLVGARVEGLRVGFDVEGSCVNPVGVGDFVGRWVNPSGVGDEVVGDLLGYTKPIGVGARMGDCEG